MQTVISRREARALGLSKYFTGKACPKGHVSERWTSSCCCLACLAVKSSAWQKKNSAKINAGRVAAYAADPERFRSDRVAWYWKNPEKARAAAQAYRAANPEKCKSAVAAYQQRNPEKTRANKARWDAANKDRNAANNRRWRIENPGKERAKQRNRRSRLLSAAGAHSAADIEWLWRVQRGRCAHSWCRAKLSRKCFSSGKKADPVDHVIPLVRGGSNNRRNLQLLCLTCNTSKGAKHPTDFARQNGMLL